MQSNFRAEKLKKAKWLLTKNLEISAQRQEDLTSKPKEKRSLWEYLKLKIFGL